MRFSSVVETGNQAGHRLDRGFRRFIPARAVLSARLDEPSIVMESHAASQ
jgi:hypothetical protein